MIFFDFIHGKIKKYESFDNDHKNRISDEQEKDKIEKETNIIKIMLLIEEED